MPNLFKGEVEINLNKAIAKKLIKPHGKCYLRYNMGVIGQMERVFKREFGNDTSIFEILRRNRENPYQVSVYETTVMLEYGLLDMFPSMNYDLAALILDNSDMIYVVNQVMEAMNIAFEGSIPMEEAEPAEAVNTEPETALEGVEGKK